MSKKTAMELDVIATLAGDGLIGVAGNLRHIEDEDPEQFALVAKLLEIAHRDASEMAGIDRIFKDLEVEDARMTGLGWPKLAILSNYISCGNRDELLELAEATTAKDLATSLAPYPPATKPGGLYFSDAHYHALAKSVLAHAARRDPQHGPSGGNEALIRAIASTTDEVPDQRSEPRSRPRRQGAEI